MERTPGCHRAELIPVSASLWVLGVARAGTMSWRRGGVRVGMGLSPPAWAAAMHLLLRLSHSRTPLSSIARASSTISAEQDGEAPGVGGRTDSGSHFQPKPVTMCKTT